MVGKSTRLNKRKEPKIKRRINFEIDMKEPGDKKEQSHYRNEKKNRFSVNVSSQSSFSWSVANGEPQGRVFFLFSFFFSFSEIIFSRIFLFFRRDGVGGRGVETLERCYLPNPRGPGLIWVRVASCRKGARFTSTSSRVPLKQNKTKYTNKKRPV